MADGTRCSLLVVEATGSHQRFNEALLEACSEFADLIYMAPQGFVTSFGGPRITIPDHLVASGGSRARQMARAALTVKAARQVAEARKPDAVLFASYNTIAMATFWRRRGTLVVDHNNPDSLAVRRIGRFTLGRLRPYVIHLALADYIGDHLRTSYGCRTASIPFPLSASGAWSDPHPDRVQPTSAGRTIFAPSARMRDVLKKQLIELATASNGQLSVAFKGPIDGIDGVWESRPHFPDYEYRLSTSDYVVIDGCYNFRVSGVAFERLSFGRPVTIIDCRFARELHRAYPSLVQIIDDPQNVRWLSGPSSAGDSDRDRFSQEHGAYEFAHRLEEAVLSAV